MPRPRKNVGSNPNDWTVLTEAEYWSDAELVKLYQFIREHELMPEWENKCAIVRLGLATGLRQAEIQGLLLKNCGRGQIDPLTQKVIAPPWVRVKALKSQLKHLKWKPVVPFPEYWPHFHRWLDVMESSRWKGHRFFCPDPRGPMKYRSSGRAPHASTLQAWAKEVFAAAGVRVLAFKQMRTNWATWEVERGLLTKHQIQGNLGHKPDGNTLDRYYLFGIPLRRYIDTPPLWPAEAAKPPINPETKDRPPEAKPTSWVEFESEET